jgi:hypothetical protein
MDCDFLLHQNCAGFPRMKRYQHGYKSLDLQCGSISEPFVHPSHPDHPLYHTLLDGRNEICDGCKKSWYYVLSCIEDDCRFVLCFKCLTLPQVVKHRVDDDPLLLCYGEKACGKYWCDICEKETNPETWFYTCKDHQSSMHTMCVLGDSVGIMPKSTIMGWYKYYEVVLNNSISRPVCEMCKSRCIFPTIMKILEASNEYVCSLACVLERG